MFKQLAHPFLKMLDPFTAFRNLYMYCLSSHIKRRLLRICNLLEQFFRTCVHRIPWLVSLTDSLTQGKRYAEIFSRCFALACFLSFPGLANVTILIGQVYINNGGNRFFRQRVSLLTTSSPTCEVDSPTSNVSSLTSKILF